MPFAHGKSLISNEFYERISKACDGKYCTATKGAMMTLEKWHWMSTFTGSDCQRLQNQAYDELFTPPLNIYNVAGKCDVPPKGIANDDLTHRSERMNAFVEENGWTWPLGPVPAKGLVYNWMNAADVEPPCTDYWYSGDGTQLCS